MSSLEYNENVGDDVLLFKSLVISLFTTANLLEIPIMLDISIPSTIFLSST